MNVTNFRSRVGASVIVGLVALGVSSPSQAMPIPSDLDIFAAVDFIGGPVSFLDNATGSAKLSLMAGGVATNLSIDTTTSTLADAGLAGTLSDFGDGVGADLAASGASGNDNSEARLFANYFFEITNNSPTDQFKITLKVPFDALAEAVPNTTPDPDQGDGAYAEMDLFVDKVRNDNFVKIEELFFTQLASDNIPDGNSIDNVDTGDFGGRVTNAGMGFFDVVIDPSSILKLSGQHDFEAGAFEPDRRFDGRFMTKVTVDNVMNLTQVRVIPEPLSATLGLMGMGVLGLATRRRRV